MTVPTAGVGESSRGVPATVRVVANWLGLAVVAWLSVVYARSVPNAEPAYAPLTGFSAHRAMSSVRSLTMQPHPTGSAGNVAAQRYIMGQLLGLGLQPMLQTTTGVSTRFAVAGRVSNIVVRLPGTRPGKAVLLMAHYDAVPAAPGAGDDAAGVAAILETLRALTSSPRLTNDVIALFTDGEEAGLVGAAAFVREHPWAKDVAVVLNFEGRGTHGPSYMFETGPGNLDVVRALRSAHLGPVRATSLSVAVYRKLPNDTDMSELAQLGLPAMNFGFIGGVDRYHTAQDDITHLDARSVQHHGNQALGLTRLFGNAPLPRPQTGDAVYFDIPAIGLVVYPSGWAIVFGILAVLLAGFAIVRGWTDAGGRPSVVRGAIATLIGTIASTIAGIAVGFALGRVHAMLQNGIPETSAIYALGIAILAVAVATAIFALVAARVDHPSLGALPVWAVIVLATSIAAPSASYLFVWPTLALAAASLAPRGSLARTISMWIAVAIMLVIIGPVIYAMAYVALGVNMVGGAIIGLFTGLATSYAIDVLRPVSGASTRWWAPLGAAAAAVVLLVTGVATVRTDDAHPAGVSLVYAADADSAGAWLTGYAATAGAQARLRRALGERDRADSTSTAVATNALPGWLRGFGNVGVLPAPREDLPRSEATIVRDSTVGNERLVTVSFRAAPGVYTASFSTTAPVIRAAVDSRPIRTDRYRFRSEFWNLTYLAPKPDSAVTLDLVLRAGAKGTLAIITRSPGMPPLALPQRPEGIVQFQGGNMTWLRYQLAL